MSEVTHLLEAAQRGDRQAAAELLPAVYDELRKLAAVRMASEAVGHTLDSTGLVHEAYLRLVGDQRFENRGHFFSAAAEAMRRILVEHARKRNAEKRGGDRRRDDLSDPLHPVEDERIIDLNEALNEFEQLDAQKALLVKLRYFAGFTLEEAAAEMGISLSTANRMWAYSRAWLVARMQQD